MGRHGPLIKDLAASLGLRAACTKKKEDWELRPELQVMYSYGIPDIARELVATPMDHISSSSFILEKSNAIMRKYGPIIWTDDSPRPWLLRPGDPLTNDEYHDLFYNDDDDRNFIKETMHRLVVQRIIRYRENHTNQPRTSSIRKKSANFQDSWTPTRSSRQRGRSNVRSSTLQAFTCWATGAEGNGHLDATLLEKAGVWLRNHHDNEADGRRLQYSELAILDNASWPGTLHAECAACKESGVGAEQISIRCVRFARDEIDAELMARQNLWIFPCTLDGKEVFAALKDEGPWDGAPDTLRRFTFAKFNGGYTTNLCIYAVLSVAYTTSTNGKEGVLKRKRDDPPLRNSDMRPSLLLERFVSPTLSVPLSESDVPARQASRMPWTAINDNVRPDQPDLTPQALSDENCGSCASSPLEAFERAPQSENLYWVTPPAERATQARETDDLNAEPPQDPTPAPTPTFRFDLGITATWCDTQKIIPLNENMDVSDVFSSVESALARSLEAKPIVNLRLWFGNTEGQYVDIEIMEEAAWNFVLRYVKQNEVLEMRGLVSRQE